MVSGPVLFRDGISNGWIELMFDLSSDPQIAGSDQSFCSVTVFKIDELTILIVIS